MKNILLFAEILPLILFYLFFADFDSMIWFSTTYLGKLAAILIIMFYSAIDRVFGLGICVLVILYYQSDLLENMQGMEGFTTPLPFQPKPTTIITEKSTDSDSDTVSYYDSVSFMKDFTVVDETQSVSLSERRLKTQEEITYPKSSDDWVYGIWKSWFVDNYTNPYPVSNYSSMQNYTVVSEALP
jgi:hypothetical protein